MKNLLQKLALCCLLLGATTAVHAFSGGGSGTSDDPYIITTPEQLNEVHNDLTANYELAKDIDLADYLLPAGAGYNSGAGWNPIGDNSTSFTGTFNGAGYKIKNLWINRPSTNNIGLFGYINGAKIDNLGIEIDPALGIKGSSSVGGLVGLLFSGSITSCYVSGSVSGVSNGSYVGGLVGNASGSITECYASGSVSGGSNVGGLVGNAGGKITQCYASGSVSGDTFVGGLVGTISGSSCVITNCYASGSVSDVSNAFVGGLVGQQTGGPIITNCYASGHVSGSSNSVGGLVGSADGSITSSFFDTQTTGQTNGVGNIPSATGVTGLLTAEMQTQATFDNTTAQWDFTFVWKMCDGFSYPVLQWQPLDCGSFIFCDGTGTTADPYLICTAGQLDSVRYFLDKNFKLANDIDLGDYLATGDGFTQWGDEGWLPIGDNTNPTSSCFTGTFNGAGHKIINIHINRPTTGYVGLFGYIYDNSAKIDSVGVEIAAGDSIKGSGFVGGVVGNNIFGSVSNCYVIGTVSGTNNVGGVVGNNQGTLTNCYHSGTVSDTGSGISNVGGVVGNNQGTLTNCYHSGTVSDTGDNNSVGGVVGLNNGGTVSNCYHSGTVSATGSGINNVGGVVGVNGGTVSNCYNSSTVSATGDSNSVGGVVGNNVGTVKNCFYDKTVCGNIGGIQSSDQTGQAEGKTTAEMKTQATFTTDITVTSERWDFTNVWVMQEGVTYPLFKWQVSQMFCGGDGTTANPYLICTPEQLDFVHFNLSANYKLANDIDLGDYLATGNGFTQWGDAGWLPIGDNTNPTSSCFTGTFNGAGHKIINIHINRPTTGYVGLFGYIYDNSAKIDSVGVEIAAGDSIKGSTFVGGVVGNNIFGSVSNCYAIGTVSGTNYVGGVVGNNQGTLTNCYHSGTVSGTGNNNVGGVVGENGGGSTVSNCYHSGTVSGTGSNYVGGVVGNNQGTLTNCYNSGTVSATGAGVNNVGGVVGYNNFGSTVKNCFYDKTVCGNIGGISGLDQTGQAEGKTTAEMKTQATFTTDITVTSERWDFTNVWVMQEGVTYPLFKWQVSQMFCGGDGTAANPYLICTPEQLDFVHFNLSANYKLANDIDLGDYLATGDGYTQWGDAGWNPIGNTTTAFTGTFNGAGHKITNLWINRPTTDNIGLFGYIYASSAKIDSVGVEIAAGDSIKGNTNVGGVVGLSQGTVTNCYNSGTINSNSCSGGVVGQSMNASVSNCYNSGAVNGIDYAGGVVGQSVGTSVSNCYNSGAVNNGINVGGVVGGQNSGSTVTNCYNSGTVNSGLNVGGVVGNNQGHVTNCYNSGAVIGGGGVVGTNSGTVQNCFYDNQTTGVVFGIGSPFSNTGATSRNTAQMKTLLTFTNANWDFANIWIMQAGVTYPLFKWQGLPPATDYGLIFDKATQLFYINFDGSGTPSGAGTPTNTTNIVYTDQADKWSFSNDTLYLNGFVWETPAAIALTVTGSDLTVDLTGTNTFKSTYTGGSNDTYGIRVEPNLTVAGSGTLNAAGGTGSGASYAIAADYNLTINGGVVNAIGGVAGIGSFGIAGANVTIAGGTVTAQGNSQAIYLESGATFSLPSDYIYWKNTAAADPGGAGTQVPTGAAYSYNTNDQFVKIKASTEYGLIFDVPSGKFYLDISNNHAFDAGTDIEYTGQADQWTFSGDTLYLNNFVWETPAAIALTVTGSDLTVDLTGTNTLKSTYTGGSNDTYGIRVEPNLTVAGSGTLNAAGGTGSGASYAIAADYNLTINGGVVNAIGGVAGIGSFGIAGANVTIAGGTVTAQGNSQAIYLESGATFSLPSDYVYWKNTAAADPGGAGTQVPPGAAYSYNTNDQFVKIKASTEYGLIFDVPSGKFYLDINDNHAFDAGTDIEYTGQADQWTFSGDTLYLNNFVWETPAAVALTIIGDLTLTIEGVNTFTSTSTGDASLSSGINPQNNLVVAGGGTLNAASGNGNNDGYGISAGLNLTIHSGSVHAAGGDASNSSLGIYVNGSLTVNGGAVTAASGNGASAGSYAINASRFIQSGGSVSATASAAGSFSFGIIIRDGSGAFNITGGSVAATGNSQAIYLESGATFSLPSDYVYWKNTAAADPGGAGTQVPPGAAYSYSTNDQFVKIEMPQIAHPTLSLSISPASPATYGNNVTLTATLAGGYNPTGMIEFVVNGSVVHVTTVAGNGEYTCTLPTPNAGTYDFFATYNADVHNAVAQSNRISGYLVNKATAVVNLSATGGTYSDNSITLTATVGADVMLGQGIQGQGIQGQGIQGQGIQGQGIQGQGIQGQAYKPAPTGTLTFKEGDTTLGTRTLNRYGTATFTIASPIDEGRHTYTADYSGDAIYDDAVSDPCTVDVTAFLSVSSLSLHFNATGGTQQLLLTCNSAWSLDNNASWLSTSVSDFKSDNPNLILNVTADANPEVTQRTALLTLSLPGIMIKTVDVTQDAGANPVTGMEAAETPSVIVYSQGGNVMVKSDAPVKRVAVYDIAGRLLKEVKGGNDLITISGLPGRQVLVVRVTSDGERSYKLRIEN